MRVRHRVLQRGQQGPTPATPVVLSMDKRVKRRSNLATRPIASSESVRKRMQSTPQRDTPAELRIRRILHSIGLRYSVNVKPLAGSSRRADIAFRRAKVAVFVDGCFWHGCPVHGTWPRANARFWREKIHANMKRDADTNLQLERQGWIAIRIWEHDEATRAARRVAKLVRARLDAPQPLKHSRK
jgi:DNA mismatch endonuclease (patch repair protein)